MSLSLQPSHEFHNDSMISHFTNDVCCVVSVLHIFQFHLVWSAPPIGSRISSVLTLIILLPRPHGERGGSFALLQLGVVTERIPLRTDQGVVPQ